MTASIHAVFAANLLSLVQTKGSIADACRGTGINRQQFNKYLAGGVLPGKQVMAKLAAYFDIDEVDLFSQGARSGIAALPRLATLLDFAGKCSATCTMPEGVYVTYSRWLPAQDHLLRTTMLLEREGNYMHFSRHYCFVGDPSRLTDTTSFWVKGMVLQDHNFVTMIGHLQGPSLPGFLVQCLNLENRAGPNVWAMITTMVLSNGMPVAQGILLEHRPGENLEMSTARDSIYPERESAIPDNIRRLMADFYPVPHNRALGANFLSRWPTAGASMETTV